ncbi:DUF6875 domain-containing protein [Nocardia sp. NPDC052566]|uniref:DUF6875 domain-containing protein n=1 Tax=Nocardia sp. NPDC052566 TaxID=3364330 RepID=UPI0037C69B8B
MLTHPTSPDRVLLQATDIEPGPPARYGEYAEALRATLVWARQYLMRPNPDLGRTGPVCPFVAGSLRHNRFHLTVCAGALDEPTVLDTVRDHRDWFLDLARADVKQAQLTTILILFPDLPIQDIPRLIDDTQAKLKLDFVESGLMIGQFHPIPPNQPGLWNPDFRPLRSPVPMLVIRHMVPSDIPFLTMDSRYLAAHRRVFGPASIGIGNDHA